MGLLIRDLHFLHRYLCWSAGLKGLTHLSRLFYLTLCTDLFPKAVFLVSYTPGIQNMLKGYIVFVRSISLLVLPSHSITKFYFKVFRLLITLQPLIKNFSYLVWGYLGGFSSILHLCIPGSCLRAALEVKI